MEDLGKTLKRHLHSMNPDFWKNRRVFLTGHTGFKGSWTSLWLQSLGAELTGYSLAPNTDPALFDVAGVGAGMNSIIGDIRDPDAVAAAMAAARPEVVIHMAAQPLVRESYADPVGTYASNVMGTVNVLEAVRKCPGVRSVVVVTSDKCYLNREWHWAYREDSELGGEDPYSNSKACSELVTYSYRKSFFHPAKHAEHGVALATGRAGNVIGGGDWAKDRLVPDALAALKAGKPLVLRHPHATRPWQHVLEPIYGYLALAEALVTDGAKHAEAWNFGPYEFSDRTVGWIVDKLCDLWGLDVPKQRETGPIPHEAGYLKVDSSKARAELGWAPKLDLDTTLRWIVEWTQVHHSGGDARAQTLAQIRRFMDLPHWQPSPAC